MLKSDSRSLSLVGRMSCERGAASARPLNLPPTTRMRISFWRRRFSASRLIRHGLGFRLPRADRRFEICAGGACELLAELIAQHAPAYLLNCAGFQIAKLERPVGDADEAVHAEAEMLEHALHLAVLAFAQ